MILRRIALGFLSSAAAALLLVTGCDDGRPPMDTSRTETKVSGTVKLKGKLVDGGEIMFNPSNAERQVGSFRAKIGPDGSYSLTTYTGGNIVKFSGPILKEHPELGLTSRFATLGSGENLVDFDLLGENDRPKGPTYTRTIPPGKKK